MRTAARADVAARLRVSRLLSTATLEPDGLPASALLVVRRVRDPLPGRLHTAGPALRVSEPWERAVRGVLADAWRGAARPASGAVPAGAQAVLFMDPAEMLAVLALDARAGRVHARWWWSALFRSAYDHDMLASVWVREARHVPAALAWLDARGQADAVVASLTQVQVRHVTLAVAAAFELPPALRSVLSPPAPHRPVASASEHDRLPARVAPSASAREESAAPWAPFLPAASVPPALSLEKQALLGIGLLLHIAPLVPRTARFAAATAVWRTTCARRDAGDSEAAAPHPLRFERLASPPHPVTHPNRSERIAPGEAAPPAGGAGPAAAAQLSPAGQLQGTAPLRVAGAPPAPAAASATSAPPARDTPAAVSSVAGSRNQTALEPASAPGDEGSSVHPVAPTPWRDPHLIEAHSTLCGVFFLLNALCRVDWFARADDAVPDSPVRSGWGWLELVARRLLGRRAQPADPLWRVLAVLDGRAATDRGGYEPIRPGRAVERYLRVSVPSLRAQLTAALRAAGSRDSLDVALLQRSGLIRASRTHVDVHMGLDQVSVAVRLAGLDANAGWVPELARVVTFHFD
jgi:hypothetical protein